MLKYAYLFDENGNCLEHSIYGVSAPDLSAFQANYGEHVYLFVADSPVETQLNAPLAAYKGTILNGQVTAVTVDPTYAPLPQVCLHVALTGGDGDPDILGVNLDGSNPIHVHATLQESSDPASPVIPVDGLWRVLLRDETGAIYDAVQVAMAQGVVALDYKPMPTAIPAIIHLEESDLIRVENYLVKLAAPVQMKVYRTLAA